MAIPYGHQSIDDSDIAAVLEALKDDWLTMGPRVAAFERDLAEAASATTAVAVSSGTAALHCAYAATGVGPGDTVVTSPLTFVATAATAMLHGADVVFADVESDTGNLNPESVESCVTERTRVIAAVDYAGHPADMDELARVAREHDVLLLEDAAHSIASTYKNRLVGSLADITTFSFFPTKNLTTSEGGAVVTSNPELADRARRFRTHGLVRDSDLLRYPDEGPWHQEVHQLGLNYRLPDVLCALGISQLARIEEFKQSRRRVFHNYISGLKDVDGVRLPERRENTDPMWHLFPIRVEASRRRKIFEFLRENQVLVQVNYIPVYWHPLFEDLGYRRGMCPVAEKFYSEEISLPMFASLTESDQSRVIELVREAVS